MKTAYKLLTLAVLAAIATACTHNNGDIGPWFGTWHVESIETDGSTLTDYKGGYFFQFQSSIFCVRYSDDVRNEYLESFGTWSEDAGTLTISFPEASVAYIDFSAVLDTDNTFTIGQRSGKRMTLTRTDAQGHVHRLALKKIP